jgi:hypothetical protein
MNRLLLCFAFFLVYLNVSSQVNYDSFVGTWIYQKNDTVFKIRLQKGCEVIASRSYESLFGGYYLSVDGIVTDNYIGSTIPSVWDVHSPAPSKNIYIVASGNTLNRVGTTFYDQRKKHLNGKGIGGGEIELIAPNKIHWSLNEREGLWPWLEGERIEGEDFPTIEEAIQGFSVPTDVILIKENSTKR